MPITSSPFLDGMFTNTLPNDPGIVPNLGLGIYTPSGGLLENLFQGGGGLTAPINGGGSLWTDPRDITGGMYPTNPTMPPVIGGGGSGGGGTAPVTPNPVTDPVIDPNAAARSAAVNRARLSYGQEAFRRGLNAQTYASDFQSYLDRILAAIPSTETSFDNYFSPNIGADVLNGVQASQRNQLGSQVNNTFGTNYAYDRVGASLLDQTISDILNQGQAGAQGVLDRGLARGQFNRVGFNAGATALSNQRAMQQSRLQQLGNDVLSGYRQQIDDNSTMARNAASGFTLGSTFNLDDYLSRANNIAGTAATAAPGQLREAIGTGALFDLGNLNQAAGLAQGSVNLNNTDVQESLARRRAINSMGRGLGSQGAF